MAGTSTRETQRPVCVSPTRTQPRKTVVSLEMECGPSSPPRSPLPGSKGLLSALQPRGGFSAPSSLAPRHTINTPMPFNPPHNDATVRVACYCAPRAGHCTILLSEAGKLRHRKSNNAKASPIRGSASTALPCVPTQMPSPETAVSGVPTWCGPGSAVAPVEHRSSRPWVIILWLPRCCHLPISLEPLFFQSCPPRWGPPWRKTCRTLGLHPSSRFVLYFMGYI